MNVNGSEKKQLLESCLWKTVDNQPGATSGNWDFHRYPQLAHIRLAPPAHLSGTILMQ
jgi:hypothetical protein